MNEVTDDQLRRKALGDLWLVAELSGKTAGEFFAMCYAPNQTRWKGVVWDRMVQEACAKYRAAHR